MKQTRIAFLGAALVLAAGSAAGTFAQDTPGDIDAVFNRLDKNGDGKVSASEIPEDQARYFQRLLRAANKDANGELTREEFRQASRPEARPNVALGGPGPEQGRADARERFEMLDRNKDGKLTLDEVPEQARERLKPIFDRAGKQELTLDEFLRMAGPGNRPDPSEMFARFDANSDGKLTADEVPERARPMFDNVLRRAGKQPDGSLTKEEFVNNFPAGPGRGGEGVRSPEGAPEGRGLALFLLLDTDRDGHISKEEFAKIAGLFDQLDRNHDGQLDPQELIGAPPGADGRRVGPQPANGRRESGNPETRREGDSSGRERPAGRQAGERDPGAIFQRLDQNGDGKISKDEAPAFLKDRFSMIDTNGDGFVTQDELRAGAQSLREGARDAQPERSRRPE